MIDTIKLIGYCSASAMLVLMLMALIYVIVIPASDRWSKNYFIVFFSLLTVCVCATFVSAIFYEKPGFVQVEGVSCYIEAIMISVLMPIPTFLIVHSCKETLIKSTLLRAVIILWGVYIALLEINKLTELFFFYTPENSFYRTRWFPLMLLPLVLIMLLNMIGLIRRRKKLSRRYFIAFLIYLLPMSAFIIIHAYTDIELILFFGIGVCALSMYSLILSDNIMQAIRQQREIVEKEREIARQRAGIMVLQMRPHFIYNTMMSIYYLCKQDADKAQQVTLDFTTYLRKNFAAIASEDTVPFTDELEHSRAYLAVEQAQFEDTLFVSFDTPHTLFRVPPLTMQPLVENAVKHGMKSGRDPIHISVATRKTDKGSEIIVEDDGAGFDPVEDNEPHIALNNIRQRLEMMCKGTLEIKAREGGGTSVRVTIPEQK